MFKKSWSVCKCHSVLLELLVVTINAITNIFNSLEGEAGEIISTKYPVQSHISRVLPGL